MLLIRQNDNWADEIEIEGFFFCNEDKWEVYKKRIAELFETEDCEQEVCVGTNESISYYSAERYFSKFSITNITDGEYNLITDLMGMKYSVTFGVIALLDSNFLLYDENDLDDPEEKEVE